MKQCLAIAGIFPPAGGAGALRQVKLFKYLRERDWEVTVVAPAARRGWFFDETLAAELRGVKVVRAGWAREGRGRLSALRAQAKDPRERGLPARLASPILRLGKSLRDTAAVPDEFLPWVPAAARKALRELDRHHYDLIFTSSFPYSSHLVGLMLRRARGVPWLVELRDPWAGHSFRRKGSRLQRRIDGLLESQVLHAADAVTVISPGVREMLAERYGPEVMRKVEVHPNGYDPADFESVRVAPRRDRLEILYVGSFDAVLEPPDPFLAALSRVFAQRPGARSRLRLRVLGAADMESTRRIRAWQDREHAADVLRMDGFVSHGEATRAMQRADILALTQADGARVYTSKVFEYLASGTPILAAVGDSDCRDLLEECGGAIAARPDEPAVLADALVGALDGHGLHPPVPRDLERVRAYAVPSIAQDIAALMNRASGALPA